MAELFKFRCFQCQKLLGVKPSRAGSSTTCPRCGTGLIIPGPVDGGEPAAPDSGEEEPEAIRLEDLGLRLDPGPLAGPAVKAPEPGPSPVAFLENLDAAPDPGDGGEDNSPEIEGPDDALTTPWLRRRSGKGGAGETRAGGRGTWSSPGRRRSPGRCSGSSAWRRPSRPGC